MSFKLQDRIQRIKGLPKKYKGLLLAMASHARNDGTNVIAANLDSVLQSIERSGYGLTLGIHSRIDDTIDAVIDRLDPPDLPWDFVAGYLDADSILASTHADDEQGLLLVNRDPMKTVANVIAEGTTNQYSALIWIGRGTWVMAGDRAAELWALD